MPLNYRLFNNFTFIVPQDFFKAQQTTDSILFSDTARPPLASCYFFQAMNKVLHNSCNLLSFLPKALGKTIDYAIVILPSTNML